ncbi:hypothetical protein tb265_38890 [Gemmatimonadetes bacterium T265]|nr:hypothetical protein tb265_38890 [Gemmatimonadetes bacterium T265]
MPATPARAIAAPEAYAPHPLPSPGGVERRATRRTRYAHGDTRTAGWLDGPIESALCCARGHHVKDGALVTGEQPIRCPRDDCRGLLWVIVTRSGAVFVAEVDWSDVRAIKALASVVETLRYLGAPIWPRPAGRV